MVARFGRIVFRLKTLISRDRVWAQQTLLWTPGVRHEVKGVIAVRWKSVVGEVAVDPLW